MNERLIVKSFGPVKDLDITFRKVTLFIGDQGTGKSTVAKLFSMFKWLEKVLNQNRYNSKYFEQHNRFETKLCKYHRIESFCDGNPYIRFLSGKYEFIYENKSFRVIENDGEPQGVAQIMYIPAERSIVSVAENKTKLLKELPDSCETFSDVFVSAKNNYKSGYYLPFEGLRFSYDSLNETGWIHGTDYKVRLINASSGIQSSLPMCMVTEYLSRKVLDREEVKFSKEEKDRLEKKLAKIIQNDAYSETVKEIMIRQLSSSTIYDRFINVVEEPELSLFPKSQKDVLLSLTANNAMSANNMLVLTSHSPYTLAIINTLLMGAKARANANETQAHELEKILSSKYYIKKEECAAYHLSATECPYCKSVMNEKTGLISKNYLDDASDDIMRIFNSLYRSYANTLSR